MAKFINFSNHASSKWNQNQIEEALKWGEIVDVPFPMLKADLTEDEIVNIGDEYVEKILACEPSVVMCQGEFTLTYYVVNQLIKRGITCVSACSERVSVEKMQEDGTVRKESFFNFVGFRKYVM